MGTGKVWLWFYLPYGFYSFDFLSLSLNLSNIFLGSVHSKPEECENEALFLELGLPSTLIRNENGAFWKRSSNRRPRNLKTTAFRVDEWRHDNNVISVNEFSSNANSKWTVRF